MVILCRVIRIENNQLATNLSIFKWFLIKFTVLKINFKIRK